jgi:hypothetical protein
MSKLQQSPLVQIFQAGLFRVMHIRIGVASAATDVKPLFQDSEVIIRFSARTPKRCWNICVRKIASIGYGQKQFLCLFLQRFPARSRRTRLHALYLTFELIDLSLKWMHLRLQVLVLRLERRYLRFHLFKLRVEREHLSLVLLSKMQALGSQKLEDSSHV